MTAPVLTKSLTALRSGINTRFPGRDKTTDGWIGDADHQLHVSGHNPDDTAGSLSEYSDADTIPEVRAIDVDKDLNDPNVTMQQVIDRILKTPNDLKRLKYIIFNGRIWSRSNDWVPKTYTGTNQHTAHAHFSGDPNYDEDASTWSVSTIGVSVSDYSAGDRSIATANAYRIGAILHDRDTTGDWTDPLTQKIFNEPNELKQHLNRIEAQGKANGEALSKLAVVLADIQAKLQVLEVGGFDPVVLEQAISDGVRAELNATRLTQG